MVAVSNLPQTEQVLVCVPSAVQVAALVIVQLPNLWLPVADIAVTSFLSPQRVQWCDFEPAVPQVAALSVVQAVE